MLVHGKICVTMPIDPAEGLKAIAKCENQTRRGAAIFDEAS